VKSRAIEGKPVQNWDVANVADGVMELVETVMTKITLFAIITQPKKNIMAEIRHFKRSRFWRTKVGKIGNHGLVERQGIRNDKRFDLAFVGEANQYLQKDH
jgi:hypothetical protein